MQPYRVPFVFDRSRAPRYRLVNVGNEVVRGVHALLDGSGLMPVEAPRALRPRESLELVIRGDDLARATSLIISWSRPNGDDYLWRVVF